MVDSKVSDEVTMNLEPSECQGGCTRYQDWNGIRLLKVVEKRCTKGAGSISPDLYRGDGVGLI